MLRLLSSLPFLPLLRAPADGPAGTLGANVVDDEQLRDRAVALRHLADLNGARVLGRAPGAKGEVQALTGEEARAVLEDGARAFSRDDRASAEAQAAPTGAATLEVMGFFDAGDGGRARFRRAGDEPAHAGKLRTADGTWWELDEPILRPEMFGAVVGDAETDETEAIRDAFRCAVSTQRVLEITKRHAVFEDIELDETFHVRGGQNSGGLRMFAGCTLRVRKGDGSETVRHGVMENLTLIDSADQSNWLPKPMLEMWRTASWRVTGCVFDGRVRRSIGVWVGRGSTVWATAFRDNRFYACQTGVVIGDTTDATHIDFSGNTVDHNRQVGAVFCNPHGGVIESNSFEWNQGRVALAVLSHANGGSAKATSMQITGNYIYNNALDWSGNENSAGVLIGHDVPGTSWTSGAPAWGMDISNNYVVSPHCTRAIRANMAQFGSIMHNIVTRHASSDFDIELTGGTQSIDVHGNNNQDLPEFDRLAVDGPYRRPAAELDGVLRSLGDVRAEGRVESRGGRFVFRTNSFALSDLRGGLSYAAEASGNGGAPSEVLSLAALGGADGALALISAQRGDGTRRASFVLHVSALADGPVAPISVAGELDGATFSVAGGVLSMTRNAAWQANATLVFAGGPAAT